VLPGDGRGRRGGAWRRSLGRRLSLSRRRPAAQPFQYRDVVEILAAFRFRPVSELGGGGLHPDQVVGVGDEKGHAADLDGDRTRAEVLVADGRALEPRVVLCEATVERFILVGCQRVSPATRRTLRTNLRALAHALEAYPQPAPVALARERAKRPYALSEVDGFLRLAAAQSTRARGLRASALICLGAGAGVIAGELRRVRGSDIVCRAGGVIVAVSGQRARTVPVSERYHERLLEAAAFAGDRYVIGGRDPDRRNVTDSLCAALSTDLTLPRLQAGRLRSTWLVECAQRIGLGVFMQAAGLSCSQRLGDLTAQLPRATEHELVALLGATP
jgi:integrase